MGGRVFGCEDGLDGHTELNIDWNLKPSSRFAKEDGIEISYEEYLEAERPLLVGRPKARGMTWVIGGGFEVLGLLCFLMLRSCVSEDTNFGNSTRFIKSTTDPKRCNTRHP